MSTTSITTGPLRSVSVAKVHSQQGFTLIELMITVVIAAILMAVAVPMFDESLTRNRRLSALESVSGMVSSARSEAVSRATDMSLCPSVDSASCSGVAWEEGALLFEDDDSDGDLDAGEELIRVFGAAGSGVTIRSKGGFATLGILDSIAFNRFGAVEDAGTLVVCDADQLVTTAAGIVINASGQARLAVKNGDTGILVLDDGTDLGACP